MTRREIYSQINTLITKVEKVVGKDMNSLRLKPSKKSIVHVINSLTSYYAYPFSETETFSSDMLHERQLKVLKVLGLELNDAFYLVELKDLKGYSSFLSSTDEGYLEIIKGKKYDSDYKELLEEFLEVIGFSVLVPYITLPTVSITTAKLKQEAAKHNKEVDKLLDEDMI